VTASDVTELELANGDFSVRVRRQIAAEPARNSEPEEVDGHAVLAPFTGIFYRSATPAAKAYADEGDWVEPETVIGLVETMKVFNEVTADVSGRIVKFTVHSGQLVHAGDVLAVIKPGERVLSGDD
jgi:acetyl-CoA carboxylase biotin carboxyl carrier protein